MQHLKNKNVVITGSSRGLGKGFAEAMATAGANVVINGTNKTALAEAESTVTAAASQGGGRVLSQIGSVADEAVCESLVANCVQEFGGIDLMVHNAGIVRDRTLMKMTGEEFDDVIAVHLRGAWACLKHAGLAMQKTGGHIILVISASGLSGGYGQGNYAAAKEGMMGLMRTALLEFPRFNIRCNAFWPVAETDMTQIVFDRARTQAESENKKPPEPFEMGFGKPQEVAHGMVWLASDQAAHLNGQCMTFNGRKTALWSHPREVAPAFKSDPWSFEELDAHYKNVTPESVYRPKMVDS